MSNECELAPFTYHEEFIHGIASILTKIGGVVSRVSEKDLMINVDVHSSIVGLDELNAIMTAGRPRGLIGIAIESILTRRDDVRRNELRLHLVFSE